MKHQIELDIEGKDYTFIVTTQRYNSFINKMAGPDKVGPAHNFVMKTLSDDSDTDAMADLLKNTGAALDIASAITDRVVKPLSIGTKKRTKSTKA